MSNIGKCYDLTDILTEMVYESCGAYFALLNPSICKISDTAMNIDINNEYKYKKITKSIGIPFSQCTPKNALYLICVRCVGNPSPIPISNPKLECCGPWHHYWKVLFDCTLFTTLYQNDDTFYINNEFLNININNQNPFSFYSPLKEDNLPLKKGNTNIIQNMLNRLIDMRLMSYENDILMTFNVFLSKEDLNNYPKGGKKPTKTTNTCDKTCGRMGVGICTIDLINNALNINNLEIAFNDYSENVEKNWTFFKKNAALYLSYGISGTHSGFHIEKLENGQPTTKSSKYTTAMDVNNTNAHTAMDINTHPSINDANYTNESFIKEKKNVITETLEILETYDLIFSLSTPAILYDDQNKTHLAVGHAKIKHSQIGNFANLNVFEAQKIAKYNTDLIKHSHYTYYLYFYTFNNETFEVTSISNLISFNNDNEPFSIYFPSGLEKACNDSYIVSYGVGDVQTKLWLLTKKDINTLLIDSNKSKDQIRDHILKLHVVNHRPPHPPQKNTEMPNVHSGNSENNKINAMEEGGGKSSLKSKKNKNKKKEKR